MPGRTVKNLEIQRWVNGGEGLGIVDAGPMQGLVVFVPRTVPGDRVDVDLVVKKKRWARGVVARFISRSEDRVDPPCPVQAECGGCPWMEGSIDLQRKQLHVILKAEVEKRVLRHHPQADIAIPPAVSGSPWNYRNRLRLAYRGTGKGRVALGFRSERSGRIVPVEECAVALPELNDALPELRAEIATRSHEEGEVRLLGFGGAVGASIEPRGGASRAWGKPRVPVTIGNATLPLPPTAFVQGNAEVATRMVQDVEAWAMEAGGSVAVELFCGAGTFTVPLLRAGYTVTGYDVADDCGEAFEASTAAFGQAFFRQQNLLGLTPFPENPPARPDVVLLDPPRSGAGEVLEWVSQSTVSKVLMVSCDIATGLRDTSLLLDDGFTCRRIQSYDLFPHTGHQEIIVELER